jgi:CubicO group peptidase (beta-lactamase class C family)
MIYFVYFSQRGAMTRLLILFTCCLLAGPIFAANLPAAKPEEVGMSTERLKRLSAAIQVYIEDGELPGAVTLIARRAKVVHFEAQGLMDIDAKRPMRTDAIFRLGSMTKPFASVAVMKLFEEGRFLLSDPISKFIPEFKNPQVAVLAPPEKDLARAKLVPAEREITIRDLLTHTAGLGPRNGSPWQKQHPLAGSENGSSPDQTICDYTRRLAKTPLHFQPGAVWEYGFSMDVLACMVEVVSGQSFDRFLAERIFKPLDMNDTFYYVPDKKLGRLATLYEAAKPKGLRASADQGRGSQVFFGATIGLFTTAEDYLKFCQMLLNRGSFGGARLLSRKTVELMTSNQIGDKPFYNDWRAGYRFGFGFRVLTDIGKNVGLSSVGEYGWSGSDGTYFWIDPKEEMIGIFMAQRSSGPSFSPSRLSENIRYEAQTLAMQAIID